MSVGTGRYTKYVPQESRSSAIYNRIKGLFNNQSSQANVGTIYAGDGLTDVATGVRANYANRIGDFDSETWATNPKTSQTAPNFADVQRSAAGSETAKAGFPANPYMPDLRSPGSEGGLGSEANWALPSSDDEALSAANYKPNLTLGAGGTANPSANVIANPITAAAPNLPKGTSVKKT